jgi:hypothetical protein
MLKVQAHISSRQTDFRKHRFFTRLSHDAPTAQAMSFAPLMAFWVHAFQDLLYLNERHITDPFYRKVARHHRAEDAGHDRWFLEDLAALGRTALDVRDLFSPSTRPVRETSYALVSEVFRCSGDPMRVVLLLSLESAGHVFFEEVARAADLAGLTTRLKYFSRFHLEVEKKHELFENELGRQLGEIELGAKERGEALAVVDRSYAAFHQMLAVLAGTEEAP